MTKLIEWLLGLESIRIGRDAPLFLKWQAQLPPWVFFVLSIAALLLIILPYWRERAQKRVRILLACLRACLVALILAVIFQPVLVLQQNRVEPSHVAVLLDVSESMAAADQYEEGTLAESIAQGAQLDSGKSKLADHSRLELVHRSLTRDDAAPLKHLLNRNNVLLVTFAATTETQAILGDVQDLSSARESLERIQPDGSRTDIGAALASIIKDAPIRRLAGIVLATDGQNTGSDLDESLALAEDRQIPVFPLLIGSPRPWVDFEVGPIRADSSVFVHDVAVIEAAISARGIPEPVTVAVDVIDEDTGQKVTSRTASLSPPDATARVELPVRPTRSGRASYRVQIDHQPQEQNTVNNSDRVQVQVLDDRVRILYVDGYPRYEYRYLKNALLREKTVNLSVLLIDADEQFVQEGTDPIRRFPESPEELNRYDVVIFGDVDPRGGWLSNSQMTMLLDFVGHQGGGFAAISGERSMPHRFVGTPLEKLLPVRIDPEFLGAYEGVQTVGFKPVMTEEGKRSRLFRPFVENNGDESSSNELDETANVFASLPELYWYARTLGPRPGASVFAHHPTAKTLSGAMPLLVLGRYGAGKILFQATDDTWRWRRHNGEFLHDAFWVQIARLLCRNEKLTTEQVVQFRTDRKVYSYGSTITIQAQLLDFELLSRHRETLTVLVSRANAGHLEEANLSKGPSGNPTPTGAAGVGGPSIARVQLQKVSSEGGLFETSFVPPHPGVYVFQLEDLGGSVSESQLTATVNVQRPDLEGRRPEANHAVLQKIATQTNGKVIPLNAIEAELAAIPDRSVRIPDDIVEPLWDSQLVLGLIVVLLSGEWVIRKAVGLT